MGGAAVASVLRRRQLQKSVTRCLPTAVQNLPKRVHLPHARRTSRTPFDTSFEDTSKEQRVETAVATLSRTMPIVPQRKLAHIWEARERWRGFVLFCITSLLWAYLQHVRVDAFFAYNTYRVYELGESAAAAAAGFGADATYRDIEKSGDLVYYLELGLMNTIALMASTGSDAICPDCRVGLTPAAGDMYPLELTDFICSDFDSQAGSSDYPTRDCAVEDARWVAAPSIYSAPCCANNTLAVLSLVLMADYSFDGPESSTMGELTAIVNDQETLRRLYERWTMAQISPDMAGYTRRLRHSAGTRTPDHLLQIIISRNQRMAGIGFKAAFVDQSWFPGIITTWQEIWSQRYDLEDTATFWWFLFFTVFDAAHELSDIGYGFIFIYKTGQHTTKTFEGLSVPRRVLAVLKSYFFSGGTAFLICIEIPSIVFPLVLELLRATGALTVINFNLCVSVALAVLLARFFQEGQVITAFQLLVLTMTKATQQLVNFLLIMVMILLVATEMHVTIFGVYTDLYDTQLHAFLGTFNSFANGLNFDNNSKDIKNSEVGYIFIYLFASLVLLLVLSQFFIAILVSAWDAAAEQEKELEEQERLPPGFTRNHAGKETLVRHVLGRCVFLLFGYSVEANGWGTRIKHALAHSVRTRQWHLEQRKREANELFAGPEAELTHAEENELFLFEHGIASAAEMSTSLRIAGLSDRCISWIMSYYAPPQRVLEVSQAAQLAATHTSATKPGGSESPPDGSDSADGDLLGKGLHWRPGGSSPAGDLDEITEEMQDSIEAVVSVLADDERRKQGLTAEGGAPGAAAKDGSGAPLATSAEVGAVAANVAQLMAAVGGLVSANETIVGELRKAQTTLAHQAAAAARADGSHDGPPLTAPETPVRTPAESIAINDSLKRRHKKKSSSSRDHGLAPPPATAIGLGLSRAETAPVLYAGAAIMVYPPDHAASTHAFQGAS